MEFVQVIEFNKIAFLKWLVRSLKFYIVYVANFKKLV